MVSVGGQGARGAGAGNAGTGAIGSGSVSASGRLSPSRMSLVRRASHLTKRGSAVASAVMCLSIVCLGAGLAKAARDPANEILGPQAAGASPGIPIPVITDEGRPLDVVQDHEVDAVVPPVKRQTPIPLPEAPAATGQALPAGAPQSGSAGDRTDNIAPPAPPAAQPPTPAHDAGPPADKREASDRSGPIFPETGGIFAPIADWLARANRDYQGRIMKELSRPANEAGQAEEQAARDGRKAMEAQAEAEAKAETKAATEAQPARAAAEAQAEKQAQAAKSEAAKLEAAKSEAAKSETKPGMTGPETAKSQAREPMAVDAGQSAAKAQQAEQQRQAEAARRDEQARREEEARKVREEAEARKLLEAARAAEERRQKQLAEEEARKQDADRKAQAERAAHEARLAAEERRAQAQAEQSAARAVAANQTSPDATGHELRHRRWAITITSEPIANPPDEPATGVLIASQRLAPRMGLGARSVRSASVKGWSWRAGRCRFAGRRLKRLPGKYTVARGDSLWRISQKHYASGRYYKRIYRANRHRIADPDLIYPCQKFRVPRR